MYVAHIAHVVELCSVRWRNLAQHQHLIREPYAYAAALVASVRALCYVCRSFFHMEHILHATNFRGMCVCGCVFEATTRGGVNLKPAAVAQTQYRTRVHTTAQLIRMERFYYSHAHTLTLTKRKQMDRTCLSSACVSVVYFCAARGRTMSTPT